MSAGFTPGPWRAAQPHPAGHYAISDDHGGSLAAVWPETLLGRALDSQANARLIAAAPELVEALERITTYFSPLKMHDNDDRRVIEEAEAVLRKARGESNA